MAAVQEDISEQREIVLTSLTEQKTAPSQCLEITAASGQEKKTNTVQPLKVREAWSDKPTKSREEVKIQKLKDIIVSQDEKITILERELAETMEALFKEREDKQQLCVKVRQQNEDITKQHIQVRHFEHEMKKNKREKEEVIAQFSKAELDKSDLTAMLRSLGKEGCKINRTLKEERSKNEKQKRKLEETQKKAEDLQNEVAELYYEVAKLEIKISDLKNEKAKLQDVNFSQEFEIKLNRTLEKETERHMFSMAIKHAEQKAALESEISEYKLSIDECKLSLEKATTKLEKTKKDNKTMSQRLRFYKARSERRGKIVQADKETKAEMKENIETLNKENEKLQTELNSGFIGRFRSVKRFFGRVVAAILSHF